MTFEPIGQIIARPDNQIGTRTLVNLDAQSLVFDSSNLFDWNKFSGYDRFETGVRANYGFQTGFTFKNGGYARILAGQSAQIAGTNAYATPDAANIGLSSGLDRRLSDMSRHLYPVSVIGYANPGPFAVAALGVGGGYNDECTTFTVNYTSIYQDNGSGTFERNNTVLVSLQLRTLGDAKFAKSSIDTTTSSGLDGVK